MLEYFAAHVALVNWPIIILKTIFLLAGLWFVLRRLASHYGIPKTVKPLKAVTISRDPHKGKRDGGAILRLPLGLIDKMKLEPTHLNGRGAKVKLAFNGKAFESDFILDIPERKTHEDIRIDRETWQEVRAAFEPVARGAPRKTYVVDLEFKSQKTRTVAYLLNEHPDRQARSEALIVGLTSLFAIAASLLFSN